MYSQYKNPDATNNDINIIQYGMRDCKPGFTVYYEKCFNFIIHYIYKGKGTFTTKSDNKTYHLTENQAFVIYPGQEVWYVADRDEPFTYRWLEFNGNRAFSILESAGLSVCSPIYNALPPYSCGEALKVLSETDNASPMKILSHFWNFADSFVKEIHPVENRSKRLFNEAIRYIHENVSSPTTVEEVAAHIGISRGFLTKVFNKYLGQPPKPYIIHYHMTEAIALLIGTNMSISEIAYAVGYDSPNDFSKAFARHLSCSPSEYRQLHSLVK